MTERGHISTKTKLLIMVRQARCPLCDGRLGSIENVDFDHDTPLALGGADDETNLRAVHRDCHRIKTSGTKATSAGSDIHIIAKTKRLSKEQEETRRRITERVPGQPRAKTGSIPSRPWPKRAKT